jgi:hypothetical protein
VCCIKYESAELQRNLFIRIYKMKKNKKIGQVVNTGVPELAPQRKQTNADHNLDSKNANELIGIIYLSFYEDFSFLLWGASPGTACIMLIIL